MKDASRMNEPSEVYLYYAGCKRDSRHEVLAEMPYERILDEIARHERKLIAIAAGRVLHGKGGNTISRLRGVSHREIIEEVVGHKLAQLNRELARRAQAPIEPSHCRSR